MGQPQPTCTRPTDQPLELRGCWKSGLKKMRGDSLTLVTIESNVALRARRMCAVTVLATNGQDAEPQAGVMDTSRLLDDS